MTKCFQNDNNLYYFLLYFQNEQNTCSSIFSFYSGDTLLERGKMYFILFQSRKRVSKLTREILLALILLWYLSWLVGSTLDRAVQDIVSCSWVRHLQQKRDVWVSLVRRLDLERPITLNSAGSVALWDGEAAADSYGGTVMIDITALVIGSTLMAWPVVHKANKFNFITWSNAFIIRGRWETRLR